MRFFSGLADLSNLGRVKKTPKHGVTSRGGVDFQEVCGPIINIGRGTADDPWVSQNSANPAGTTTQDCHDFCDPQHTRTLVTEPNRGGYSTNYSIGYGSCPKKSVSQQTPAPVKNKKPFKCILPTLGIKSKSRTPAIPYNIQRDFDGFDMWLKMENDKIIDWVNKRTWFPKGSTGADQYRQADECLASGYKKYLFRILWGVKNFKGGDYKHDVQEIIDNPLLSAQQGKTRSKLFDVVNIVSGRLSEKESAYIIEEAKFKGINLTNEAQKFSYLMNLIVSDIRDELSSPLGVHKALFYNLVDAYGNLVVFGGLIPPTKEGGHLRRKPKPGDPQFSDPILQEWYEIGDKNHPPVALQGLSGLGAFDQSNLTPLAGAVVGYLVSGRKVSGAVAGGILGYLVK